MGECVAVISWAFRTAKLLRQDLHFPNPLIKVHRRPPSLKSQRSSCLGLPADNLESTPQKPLPKPPLIRTTLSFLHQGFCNRLNTRPFPAPPNPPEAPAAPAIPSEDQHRTGRRALHGGVVCSGAGRGAAGVQLGPVVGLSALGSVCILPLTSWSPCHAGIFGPAQAETCGS